MVGIPLLPPRDLDLLHALDRCTLTAAQLLTLSHCFSSPFPSERKTRARLQVLTERGFVRSFRFATAGSGRLAYYKLSPEGFHFLHGPGTPLPSRKSFGPVGLGRLMHTHSLAAFVVHTTLATHRSGMELSDFRRENSIRLECDAEFLYPDCTFTLATAALPLRFFVELDTGSERNRSDKLTESWERKIRFYDSYQDRCPHRFRVLVVTTAGSSRLGNILQTAAELTRIAKRLIFYGVRLEDYLAEADALYAPCFTDHRGQRVSLIPSYLPDLRTKTPVAGVGVR